MFLKVVSEVVLSWLAMAASNENVATDYIELEDGQVVEGDKVANIRKRVRDIF